MELIEKISELKEMFYKDENNSYVLNVFWNSLFIAFLLMPLGINMPTPFFIIAVITGIINIFKSKKNFIADNKVLLLFPFYFLLMAISLIYTENIPDGVALLQRSLTLLFFPVIFLFVKEDALTVRKLFDFLLWGLIVSFFINLSLAGYDTFIAVTNDGITNDHSPESFILSLTSAWDYFINTEFSRLINPNYVSIYILLVLSYYLKKDVASKTRLAVVVILFIYLFLSASIASYITLLIVSLLLISDIADKTKKHTTLIIFFLGAIVFLNNPHVLNFYEGPDNTIHEKESTEETSEKLRFLSWDAGWKLMSQSPLLGYGIGDANKELIEKYKELNYTQNYKRRYNAHNQFLQTWLQMGMPGLITLISIFIILAYRMRRSRSEMSVFIILFISLLFESMLVRFNGIVFFSIIVPLLLKKRSILSSKIIRNETVFTDRI
ncbi:O-antigen ligase family protein [Abyssalbus ytuae]|uniref:O-antigen ligase family protein n=1 Tax=Abyssalbus ytuae TaxID=2926907 RepID=A0A9E7A1S0_9FLAO|nr:O-antigen ligase family protein [Abyssalbus ytuae]UOB19432.1 O-antigen ligase family protein [Abyssalbus ytuae]